MVKVDIVIFGGGIAGLWTLATLTKQGYNAILLENTALGAGQTIKSQGIIHGGLKYALTGHLDSAVTTLQAMPQLWQQCLLGKSSLDLSTVRVLSDGQYLWSVNKLSGAFSGILASNTLHGTVNSVDKSAWPEVFHTTPITSKLYKLQEIVLDVPSLIRTLSQPYLNRCFKLTADQFAIKLDPDGSIKSLTININGSATAISAQKYIFTAGHGNAALIKNLSNAPAMQLRPLQMVLVKSPKLLPLYGHCVALSSTPRITITTHRAQDGTPVWYLGGELAEDGARRSIAEHISYARQELAKIFPRLNLLDAEYAGFYVDRAEAKQNNGGRPNSTTVFAAHNYITAWPTKLALAPLLAQQVQENLQASNVLPQHMTLPEQFLPAVEFAAPIWDTLL